MANQRKKSRVYPLLHISLKETIQGIYSKASGQRPYGAYTPSEKTWKVNVQSTDNSSGNRIWDETGMPTTYTWNAQSYSGFYYDLDSGVSSEEMTIRI